MNFAQHVSPTPREAAEACGAAMLEILRQAINERATAALAVSGGHTPKLLFQFLAARDFNWSPVHVFWVDERAVPPGDPQSNYTLAQENWLQPANVPASNIHRIHAQMPVADAAERYADDIVNHFGLKPGESPVFDIIQQ